MSEGKNNMNGGLGFFGLLQILFIGLKLTDYISWSWWTIFIPAYIWFVLLIILFFLLFYLEKRNRLWK